MKPIVQVHCTIKVFITKQFVWWWRCVRRRPSDVVWQARSSGSSRRRGRRNLTRRCPSSYHAVARSPTSAHRPRRLPRPRRSLLRCLRLPRTAQGRPTARRRYLIESLLGSKGFRFWRKTDKMTKTGRRDENIDFWHILTKLANFGICGKILDEICTFWRTKNGILGCKIWRRSRESIKSKV